VQGARNGRRDQRHLVFSPAHADPQCRELGGSCQGTTFVPEDSETAQASGLPRFLRVFPESALSGVPGDGAPDPHTTLI
jgi:hypothetical protein